MKFVFLALLEVLFRLVTGLFSMPGFFHLVDARRLSAVYFILLFLSFVLSFFSISPWFCATWFPPFVIESIALGHWDDNEDMGGFRLSRGVFAVQSRVLITVFLLPLSLAFLSHFFSHSPERSIVARRQACLQGGVGWNRYEMGVDVEV